MLQKDIAAHDLSRRVLAVDDDATSLFLIEQQLLDLGFEPVCVTSGDEAINTLDSDPDGFAAVILDRMMPGKDGIEIARELHMRDLAQDTQIIMLSGADSQEEIQEGIEAGIFYYLTKPTKVGLLNSILGAAIKQAQRNRQSDKSLRNSVVGSATDAASFTFRTLDEARALATFISAIFPDPRKAHIGVDALLTNAVEHGLAGIGFEEKGKLLATGDLGSEIDRRLADPEHANKTIEAKVARKPDGTYLVIQDPGKGFNWREFFSPDQSRAATTHGRGIAQANMRSFDSLKYNEAGNRLVAFSSQKSQLEW